MDLKATLKKFTDYYANLVESGGKLSSTKFFLTLFNISLLCVVWHKELTQPAGVSSELLIVAYGLLAGNYQFSKMQRFKQSTTPTTTLISAQDTTQESSPAYTSTLQQPTQSDATKENKNGEQ